MKLYNFNFEEELIKQIDKAVSKSNNQYRDRTHFIILAIQEKLKKEIKK